MLPPQLETVSLITIGYYYRFVESSDNKKKLCLTFKWVKKDMDAPGVVKPQFG